jgi:hypothetical protein
MGRGADDFYAAVEGLLMGLGADEGGQEGMMNIDDLLRKLFDKAGGKHLHIAGQDDQFDIIFAKKINLLPLGLLFCFFANRNDAIRDAVEVCVIFRVGMIADYQGDFAGEFAGALPVEQIDETVIVFGNKNSYARAVVRGGDAPLNRKLLGDGSKPFGKIFQVEFETCEIPFDACEIGTFQAGLVLLEMKDVAAMPVDEIRDCGIEAFAIGAPQ